MEVAKNLRLMRCLLDLTKRPSSQQALEFSSENILKTAKNIGYPTYLKATGEILKIHKASMPILESVVVDLLKKEEGKSPDYYAFARDCDLLYDALSGVALAGENKLFGRVHYIKTSTGMKNRGVVNKEYFNQIGITESRFKKGTPMVFLDSGFRGSLFHSVSNWVGFKGDLFKSENMKGYLISSYSSFGQLDSGKVTQQERDNFMDITYSKYGNYFGGVSGRLCSFMQLMPKFTGRYIQTFQDETGNWDVMPEKNTLVSNIVGLCNPKDINGNWYSHQSIEKRCLHVNSDVLDPATALLLQGKTLKYFSNPNVYDRIYSKIAKA